MEAYVTRLYLVLALMACSPINNKINSIELACGEKEDFDSYRYIKLYNESGELPINDPLEVKDELGRSYPELVTPKRCIKIPKSMDRKLIAIRSMSNEGEVLLPHRISEQTLYPLILKSFRYKSVSSVCKGPLVTNAMLIPWPIHRPPWMRAMNLSSDSVKAPMSLKSGRVMEIPLMIFTIKAILFGVFG